jgi:hypothetical protein
MTIPRNREIAGTITILSNGAVSTGRQPPCGHPGPTDPHDSVGRSTCG